MKQVISIVQKIAWGNAVFLITLLCNAAQENRPLPLQAEEQLSVVNATPYLINIVFETNKNPAVTEHIQPNSSRKISRKNGSLTRYSFDQGSPIPITPDMIVNQEVTIKLSPGITAPPSAPTPYLLP